MMGMQAKAIDPYVKERKAWKDEWLSKYKNRKGKP